MITVLIEYIQDAKTCRKVNAEEKKLSINKLVPRPRKGTSLEIP